MMCTSTLVRIAATIALLLIVSACATSHRKECKGRAVPINDSPAERVHGTGPGR